MISLISEILLELYGKKTINILYINKISKINLFRVRSRRYIHFFNGAIKQRINFSFMF